jgi:tryptophan-rich sensory protein
MWAFSKVSGPAALLLAPYLAWVSFASYLNFMFLTLNG